MDVQAAEKDLRRLLGEIAPQISPTQENMMARSGVAGPAIVDAANEVGADLIVMGALDRDPMFTRLMGSVARHVARNANCSVLLIPQPRLEGDGYRRVVADLALDAASLRMVELLVSLVQRKNGATIELVHEFSISEAVWALKSQSSRNEHGETVEDYARSREYAEQQILDEFLSGVDFTGIEARKLALPGRDGVEAIERARAMPAELLAMPAPVHRLSFLDRVFHHPAERALQRLPSRLLLYRERVFS